LPAFNRAAEVTLLVRVEKIGRVSDSRIEVSSGTQRVDEAAQRCLMAHGLLSPRRVNGEPVASWQRVHWPALSTAARLL
jgi:TonB family protein